ncbi:endoplasmic reticulum protein 29 [Paragonimus westermani]|uniref:Endoplasmic reticulum protein 29 n=1 Tax=Paragonimus westermani TaxID=34504 RepID=A0A5J4N8E7_9TREM|nr:endoplasmic reticulum protein 29 [Paragonimus westermani]
MNLLRVASNGLLLLFVLFTVDLRHSKGSESWELSYFSEQTNLTHLLEHLNDTPYTFVAVFDSLFPADRFLEYQDFAKHLKTFTDLNVYHMLHNPAVKYGENIFTKFNLTYVELPYYMLFSRESYSPVTYRGSWKSEDILRWIAEFTGLGLALPGCVASLDTLAHQARTASPEQLLNQILPQIKHIVALRHYVSSEFAQYYRTVAEKLVSQGPSFLAYESVRLRKLADSEVSDWQKSNIKKRLNILTQFTQPTASSVLRKTEL